MEAPVERDWLPQWGWLLLGLLLMAVLGNVVNLFLFEVGMPERYTVVPIIALMAPVLVLVGIWFEDDRRHYWAHGAVKLGADLGFTVAGTAIGATAAVAGVGDASIPAFVRDFLAMIVGFAAGWALFYFRNLTLYRDDPTGR